MMINLHILIGITHLTTERCSEQGWSQISNSTGGGVYDGQQAQNSSISEPEIVLG